MSYQEQIEKLYQAYVEEGTALEKKRKPWEGIFGFGKKPADDPCHTRFIQALEEQLSSFREAGIPSAEARDVLRLIFRYPVDHPCPASVYWMLLAAHGTAFGLIPHLQEADAAALKTEYEALYPRRGRLPVQDQVLKALEKVR